MQTILAISIIALLLGAEAVSACQITPAASPYRQDSVRTGSQKKTEAVLKHYAKQFPSLRDYDQRQAAILFEMLDAMIPNKPLIGRWLKMGLEKGDSANDFQKLFKMEKNGKLFCSPSDETDLGKLAFYPCSVNESLNYFIEFFQLADSSTLKDAIQPLVSENKPEQRELVFLKKMLKFHPKTLAALTSLKNLSGFLICHSLQDTYRLIRNLGGINDPHKFEQKISILKSYADRMEIFASDFSDLFESGFPLKSFDQYPHETGFRNELIAFYSNTGPKNNKTKPHALVFMPMEDPNHAFTDLPFPAFDKIGRVWWDFLNANYNLTVTTIDNAETICEVLRSKEQEGAKIALTVLSGHGTPIDLHFKNTFEGTLGLANIKKCLARLPPQSTVILNACLAGSGGPSRVNLANAIANVNRNIRVFSSLDNTPGAPIPISSHPLVVYFRTNDSCKTGVSRKEIYEESKKNTYIIDPFDIGLKAKLCNVQPNQLHMCKK